jgi:hypothetical protein
MKYQEWKNREHIYTLKLQSKLDFGFGKKEGAFSIGPYPWGNPLDPRYEGPNHLGRLAGLKFIQFPIEIGEEGAADIEIGDPDLVFFLRGLRTTTDCGGVFVKPAANAVEALHAILEVSESAQQALDFSGDWDGLAIETALELLDENVETAYERGQFSPPELKWWEDGDFRYTTSGDLMFGYLNGMAFLRHPQWPEVPQRSSLRQACLEAGFQEQSRLPGPARDFE